MLMQGSFHGHSQGCDVIDMMAGWVTVWGHIILKPLGCMYLFDQLYEYLLLFCVIKLCVLDWLADWQN